MPGPPVRLRWTTSRHTRPTRATIRPPAARAREARIAIWPQGREARAWAGPVAACAAVSISAKVAGSMAPADCTFTVTWELTPRADMETTMGPGALPVAREAVAMPWALVSLVTVLSPREASVPD